MPRYAQLVMGPAGAGKSTYVNTVEVHYATLRRKVHCINLDPAAEHFAYPVQCDIRELISVDDVMEDNEMRFLVVGVHLESVLYRDFITICYQP